MERVGTQAEEMGVPMEFPQEQAGVVQILK
jgi:hypothetical protein